MGQLERGKTSLSTEVRGRPGLRVARPTVPPLAHTDPPSVSAVNAVVLTAVGQEAVLLCAASGVPPPRIIWYRGALNGEEAQEMSTRVPDLQFSERSLAGKNSQQGRG